MINFFRENATEPNLPGYFSIHTEGSGILADAYNSLINSLSPVWGNFNAAGRWKICLLRPDVPDFDTYLLIAGLLLLALITILFEIYIHRTRHYIW